MGMRQFLPEKFQAKISSNIANENEKKKKKKKKIKYIYIIYLLLFIIDCRTPKNSLNFF